MRQKPIKKIIKLLSLICLNLTIIQAVAANFPLPDEQSNIVGQLQTVIVERGDTLTSIARQYDLGYYQLIEANPQLNPEKLKAGQKLVIPNRYILPNQVARKGIVINLAELRLYYFDEKNQTVFTAPVGIGRQNWDTPLGQMKIIQKVENPYWYPPQSVREDVKKKYNMDLPKAVPPGPDNPLGHYKIRLSRPSYLIHGTNAPAGVGRRVSAGCIRMYPEDIKKLYNMVEDGASVNIINQPFKVGTDKHIVYLEAHKPLMETREQYGDGINKLWLRAINTYLSPKESATVNWQKVNVVGNAHHGIPDAIAKLYS